MPLPSLTRKGLDWLKHFFFPFKRDFHASSVAQLCLTLFDPMDCSAPGLPVHHQLSELAQTQIHRVSDAIQPSHPLSSPSPPTFNLSQHQGLFQRVSSLHQVAKMDIKKIFLSTSDPCEAKTVAHQDPFTQTMFVHGTDRNWAPIMLGTKQGTKYRELFVGSAHAGLPWWLSGKEPACQCRRHGFDS